MTSAAAGFQKLAFTPRLTGAALGGTLGFAASPEDEGQAAGLTGAALGYGAGALVDRLHKRVTGTPETAKVEKPGPVGPPVTAAHSPAELAAAQAEIERTLDPRQAMQHFDQQLATHKAQMRQAQRAGQKPQAPQGASSSTPVQQKQQVLQQLQQAKAPARKPVQQTAMAALSPEAQARVSTARSAKRMPKIPLAKVGFEKLSDYSASTGVGPLSVGVSSKEERLPGMNRWVPRATIEQAYQGLQQGLDQQALTEQAAASGNIAHPAVGAGLAAALARFGLGPEALGRLGGSSRAGVGLAALAGGGAGALYNQLTAKRRAAEMGEAIKGVQGEQEGMGHHTAREAMPMVVSSAGSNQ